MLIWARWLLCSERTAFIILVKCISENKNDYHCHFDGSKSGAMKEEEEVRKQRRLLFSSLSPLFLLFTVNAMCMQRFLHGGGFNFH